MSQDLLQRFIFDNSDVRGEIVTLEHSYQAILANGSYPEVIGRLLGEITAAAGLLSATLKFDGILTIQARGDGDLSLLMADCTRQHLLRGIATLQEGIHPTASNLGSLLGAGHLAITVDPAEGERYQGIVSLESDSLATCIEGYFNQSEQLPTRLWLFSDDNRAGGLLLQALPLQEQTRQERNDYWDHLCALTDTLGPTEFLGASPETILTRLYHQEKVRLFPPTELEFGCSCSENRTAGMLRTLGEEEVNEILKEQGEVAVQCQFCHQQYTFTTTQVEAIFSSETRTVH